MKKNMILHCPLCCLPQKELTTHVGVTRQSIIAIEHGKYAPSAVLAMKIENRRRFFLLEETD